MKPVDVQLLIEAADKVRKRAYAKYSGFQVGAALLSGEDQIHVGCNVENASFGLTLCAERTAASAAIAAGECDFRRLVLVSRGSVPPCGACRQFLIEFRPQLEIILVEAATLQIVHQFRLAELLPHQFDTFATEG